MSLEHDIMLSKTSEKKELKQYGERAVVAIYKEYQ